MEKAHEHTGSADDAAPPPVLKSNDTTREVAERSAGDTGASAGPITDTSSSRPKTRKRGRAPNAPPPTSPPLSSPLVSVKPEPVVEDDEGANNESAPPQPHNTSDLIEGGHEGHQLPSTSPGVATRRSKHHELTVRQEENAGQKEGESDEREEEEVQGSEALVGRSSSSSSDNEDGDNVDSMDVSRVRRSSSRSHSALPMTPTMASSTTQRSASLASTAGAAIKAKPDEALEAITQAGIAAQERQLRHTLLSIFPAHLRTMPPTFSSSPSGTRGPAPPCSPEPLLPLLEALCEDKAFVHAAWCRYEDDVAVQRMQNSIQRKRQRHSFSKGGRKAASATANSSANASSGGRGESESESDGDEAGEEHQPPQSEWVEAPPALVGPPRTSPRNASAPTAVVPEGVCVGDDGSTASASGFQWTPWRFFREKRLRSSRRPQGSAGSVGAAAASAAVGTMASTSTTTASSASASGAASSPSLTTPATTTAPATTAATTANASSAPTAPTVAAAVGVSVGGVPPLIFSEVPSLPVQQVDAEVPEEATATVPAMTAEEQRTYARYVMSSGKLRNVCRDPYTFLVTRAKEMRIQWERQHPFE